MQIVSYLAGAAIASALVCAGTDAHAAAAAAGVAGKVTLPISISFLTAPASAFTGQFSTLSCSMTISSDDVLMPVDTVTAPVKVSGRTASCSLDLNYLWHVVNAKSHMTVSYSVNGIALDSTGHQSLTRLSTGGVDKIILPANGATTAYKSFRVVL